VTGTIVLVGRTAAGLLLTAAIAGCGAARAPEQPGARPARPPGARAAADSGRPTPNPADVQFVSGMIGHHAQAVLIAGWAPTHGASPAVRTLAERVAAGQQDEMALMEAWLRDRGETNPGADSSHQMMARTDHSGAGHAAGAGHPTPMPGMLTAEELARLDRARGAEFDRLFLTYMIKHHQGALTMVDRLFASRGAARDETVFRLASDVYADQSTEIDRMQKLLAALPAERPGP
jgi:uncharacterized protein (DUF305 family)